MRRKLKSILIIAIVILITMQSFTCIFADGEKEEPKINLKAEVGFDGYYKLGYYAPFYFEIENNMKDINGELQVEIPDEANNVTLYATQFNLPNNSKKKFTMNIPMNRYNTKLQVNIVEGKEKLFTKSIRINPGANMETLGIGILSDDYESVKYINKISTGNNYNFKTKTVAIKEDMLSENTDILSNFNVIVINNYDTSKLSKEKYEAIKNWVADGGVLLVGTGPSHNKTLAMFKDDYITGEIGDISNVTTNKLHILAGYTTSIENMQLSALKMNFKDTLSIVKEGDMSLIVNIPKGRGSVAIAAFDFGLEPIVNWAGRTYFSEKLLQRLTPSLSVNPYAAKSMYMVNNLYGMDNSLRTIPELPKTKTRNLIIVLFIYIVVVAPISYFILKKMDKREFMWISVPVIALVFALAIYVTGIGTRLNEPIINAINIVDFGSSKNAIPMSFAGVFTPNKSNIKLEASEGMGMKPMVLNVYNQYMQQNQQNEKKLKKVVSKVTVSPKTTIEFYKNSVWSMKTLSLSNNQNLSGSFDTNINYSKNAYTGTVKNNSGFDLQECYLITSYQVIEIGPIKANETVTISNKKGKYYTQSYDMINTIYKDPHMGRKPGQRFTQKEIDDFRNSFQKRQVMEFYLMNGNYNITGAKLIGWSNTPISKDILVNGKITKKYEKSLILADTSISFKTGNKVSYPMGYLQPTIMNDMRNGNYDAYGKTFYGRGEFEVQFQIDKNIVPDSVKLQYLVNHGGQSTVKQYIWDVEKGSWQVGSYSAFNIEKDKISKYIDRNNVLKLKFEMNDGSIGLPQMSLEGSVK